MSLELGMIALVVALLIGAALYMLSERTQESGYRLEVEPAEAALVKDIFSGKVRVFMPGSYTLKLCRDKEVGRVSLKDEPRDLPPGESLTADKVPVILDLVVVKQRIQPNQKAVLHAWLDIDYSKRNELIEAKINVAKQNSLIVRRLEDIFEVPTDDATPAGTPRAVRRDILKAMEEEINLYLLENVTNLWGLEVKVETNNARLSERLQEVAEEVEAAKEEGRATAARAEAAGVDVMTAYLGEVFVDAMAALGGRRRHKKGGDN